MNRIVALVAVTLCLTGTVLFMQGCIVRDELTTITVNPDGSAEWIRHQSNIRSTEKGKKGAEELQKFVDDFNARKDPELVRMIASGGEIVEARWIRSIEPYATLVVARLPTATAVETFFTLKNDKDEIIARPRFTQNGTRRKLAVSIPLPKDAEDASDPTEKKNPSLRELRAQQANSISETRLVIARGHIISSQGFAVAADGRSCLIDPTRIEELTRGRPESIELFVEWEVAEPQGD